MAVNNGVEEISGNHFEERIKSGITVVDFFAEWCMPCVMMAPVVEELKDKFKGKINFLKANVDENSSLSNKFKVLSIPTLIVFKDGKEVERFVGSQPADILEEKLMSVAK